MALSYLAAYSLILLFITGLRYLEFGLTMQGYTDISFAWLLWYGFAAFYAGYRHGKDKISKGIQI